MKDKINTESRIKVSIPIKTIKRKKQFTSFGQHGSSFLKDLLNSEADRERIGRVRKLLKRSLNIEDQCNFGI